MDRCWRLMDDHRGWRLMDDHCGWCADFVDGNKVVSGMLKGLSEDGSAHRLFTSLEEAGFVADSSVSSQAGLPAAGAAWSSPLPSSSSKVVYRT
ncbi:hypothetical protein CYMTET_29628 [Cymbomonas tetramitiformis]|uniref:Uncharacterized protein n=1 Tax=Cymbomonas tetramitiformis TaxID=36881 RepID=A0AAE0KUR4_9CHLO|nr:hypothetical protein CYMTET_29628 [Cymbomonas tetramitiformis]